MKKITDISFSPMDFRVEDGDIITFVSTLGKKRYIVLSQERDEDGLLYSIRAQDVEVKEIEDKKTYQKESEDQ